MKLLKHHSFPFSSFPFSSSLFSSFSSFAGGYSLFCFFIIFYYYWSMYWLPPNYFMYTNSDERRWWKDKNNPANWKLRKEDLNQFFMHYVIKNYSLCCLSRQQRGWNFTALIRTSCKFAWCCLYFPMLL